MFRIQEFSDVMADACLRDSEGRFLFLSLFGRDNAILQFLAAMELPRAEQGVDRFHLVDAGGQAHPVDVGGTDRLSKHSGRLPRQNIFGPVSHLWVFDATLTRPDLVNRHAWVLRRTTELDDGTLKERLLDQAWETVKTLSPVPLLDDWREPVMTFASAAGMVRLIDDRIYPPLGPIAGARVALGQHFLPRLSTLVAAGDLRLPVQDSVR
jgi:hypothetical protein